MIDYKESSVRVFFSSNYAQFKFLDGNRQLNEVKIKKIMEDIESGIDVLKYYPIQVKERDGRLDIIDGQHRFYISKKLGRPVFFIVLAEERSLYDIAVINSNTEKWKVKDFINCYVNLDNPHYKELDEFMRKYNLTATLCAKLLADGSPGYGAGGKEATNDFQRGRFEVKQKDAAVKLADAVEHFKDFRHSKNANFFGAIHKIMEAGKVDIMDLVKKYHLHKEDLVQQSGWKEYINNLATIYNKRRQTWENLYE